MKSTQDLKDDPITLVIPLIKLQDNHRLSSTSFIKDKIKK